MNLIEKMIRAAKLEAEFYEEVEKDEEATREALLVVLIVGICSAIGTLGTGDSVGILKGLISAIVGWVLWSAIIFLVAILLNRRVGISELLRCLGFAYSPHVLNILGLIPLVGFLVYAVVFFWGLAAFVVAVRQALDCETPRAIVVVILSSIPYVIIRFAFGL
ncbi:MAG TPA: YIP1 family protein [Thermodesulfobacteriota bacterium]|nr:YIP1 family protein [Thermodesulfobacteriota bacterium]